MLYIVLIISLFILSLILVCCGTATYSTTMENIMYLGSLIVGIIAIGLLINGCFNGFINYPPTEGTHVGEITAIDLEGVWFRRWEVYLKSDGFSSDSDGKISNETKYLLYENERELVEQLKEYQGKKVKLYYGFEGGRIKWNSCGTYHITKVELVEEK